MNILEKENKMSEITHTPEQEVILAHLEYETPVWLALKQRAERAGNLNAEFNQERDQSMERINFLLETLSEVATREVVYGQRSYS